MEQVVFFLADVQFFLQFFVQLSTLPQIQIQLFCNTRIKLPDKPMIRAEGADVSLRVTRQNCIYGKFVAQSSCFLQRPFPGTE